MRWDSSKKDCTENCPLLTLKLMDTPAKDCTEECPLLNDTWRMVRAMVKQKKSGLRQIFYMVGTLVIAVMLVIVGINFVRDARILQKPLLSTSTPKKSDSGNVDGYKTIKYKKPAANSTKKPDKPKTSTAPAKTAEPAVVPPTTIPGP